MKSQKWFDRWGMSSFFETKERKEYVLILRIADGWHFLWNAHKRITNPLCWKLSRNIGRITHLVSMFVLAEYPFPLFIIGCTCSLNVCCPQVPSQLDILVEMLICWRTIAKVQQVISRTACCTAADAQLTVTLSNRTVAWTSSAPSWNIEQFDDQQTSHKYHFWIEEREVSDILWICSFRTSQPF